MLTWQFTAHCAHSHFDSFEPSAKFMGSGEGENALTDGAMLQLYLVSHPNG